MGSRRYGQYCGLTRALELVGERWALLVVRDLLVGPRRFTDLRQGLPRIPTNILSARLKELEETGVVRRRVLARPATGVVYELTAYGAMLEDAVIHLGRWGAMSLGDPKPDEVVTTDSLIMALRTTFHPERALRVRAGFELRLGEIVVHARVDDGTVEVGEGALLDADLVIETGPAIRGLMAGEVKPADAIANGSVALTGDPGLLSLLVELFAIERKPVDIPA